VGTGVNAHPEFAARFSQQLSKLTQVQFTPGVDLFALIGSQDTAVAVSGQLKATAVSLMKIANDLRWMNSGPLAGLGEIELEALQPCSSIMPGKVNPVIPEATAMVAAQVIGNDTVITIAGQSGNFELNVMLPIIAQNLLSSIELLANASSLMCFGIMLGAFGLFLVDRKVSGASPEMLIGTAEHPVIPPRIWLFVFAIITHNIPEGMAVGVSAGGGMPDTDSLAMGIALVLAGAGMSRIKAFVIGAASGLVEPVFALLCAWLVSLAELLLPLGLGLAAGAMLLVVTHEVIPESRRNGHDKLASLGLLIGFCLMMVIDTALA
jgi:zinc transporter ZupT